MSKEERTTKEIRIDPTALVHPTAEMDSGVEIGPYSVIGEGVRIGKNTRIASHVVIDKWTTIGSDCEVYQFSSIGAPPQDLGYKGEKTELIIGNNNIIREFVTMHRATTKGDGKTECGDSNLFMNYVHIAHDCKVGNHVIMANAATLGGLVDIDDHAIVGGLVAVHQHVRIGTHCIIGGGSIVRMDIPPYVMAAGNKARLYRLNSIGLKRQGFSEEALREIKEAYKILFKSSLSLKRAMEKLSEELPDSKHAKIFLEFIKNSKRGIVRLKTRRRRQGDGSEEN
ncbi:MAG: acyl-ACP--UDP-N-acetylglucosamine O-acyltransferase [Thermodesulfobacteriota bacterium]